MNWEQHKKEQQELNRERSRMLTYASEHWRVCDNLGGGLGIGKVFRAQKFINEARSAGMRVAELKRQGIVVDSYEENERKGRKMSKAEQIKESQKQIVRLNDKIRDLASKVTSLVGLLCLHEGGDAITQKNVPWRSYYTDQRTAWTKEDDVLDERIDALLDYLGLEEVDIPAETKIQKKKVVKKKTK